MKFLLAFSLLTSLSAFAGLQETLINSIDYSNSKDIKKELHEDIKKALYVEVYQAHLFECKGAWGSTESLASNLVYSGYNNWKIKHIETDNNNTIYAETKYNNDYKLAFTFEISEDLKQVNSFTYAQWKVSLSEVNVGTLLEPIFETAETKDDVQSTKCNRI